MTESIRIPGTETGFEQYAINPDYYDLTGDPQHVYRFCAQAIPLLEDCLKYMGEDCDQTTPWEKDVWRRVRQLLGRGKNTDPEEEPDLPKPPYQHMPPEAREEDVEIEPLSAQDVIDQHGNVIDALEQRVEELEEWKDFYDTEVNATGGHLEDYGNRIQELESRLDNITDPTAKLKYGEE